MRERSMMVASHTCQDWGSNLQLRHVPWQELNPQPFGYWTTLSNQYSHTGQGRKGRTMFNRFSMNSGYSFWCYTSLSDSFLNLNCSGESETMSVNFYTVTLKSLRLSVLWMNWMHYFITFCTSHWENIGSLSYSHLPKCWHIVLYNINKWYSLMSPMVLSEKS